MYIDVWTDFGRLVQYGSVKYSTILIFIKGTHKNLCRVSNCGTLLLDLVHPKIILVRCFNTFSKLLG